MSTDYDTSDRLYFEPLTFEDVMNIVEKENPHGVIVQFGGQTPLKLAVPLEKAGVNRARGLVTAVATDADNVFLVLIAKELNPDLFIVARARQNSTKKTLTAAGANKVISPYRIGSHSITNAALRPNMMDFVETVTTNKELELSLDEFPITADSPLAGLTLVESKIRERFGIIVVACRAADGSMTYNPPANHVIREEEVLIILGRPDHLATLDHGRDEGAL